MTSRSTKRRKAKSTGNPVGRPPLPPEDRRVRLDSLVSPATRRKVQKKANAAGMSYGKVIDKAVSEMR